MTLTTDEVRTLLYRAKSGTDRDAALELISFFRDMLSDGGSFDRRLLDEYVLDAFEKICPRHSLGNIDENTGWIGESADQAFGLKPSRGHHARENHTDRNIQIAAYVELLCKHRSSTWESACGIAANYFFNEENGDRATQQAHKKYKALLRGSSEDELLSVLPDDLRH